MNNVNAAGRNQARHRAGTAIGGEKTGGQWKTMVREEIVVDANPEPELGTAPEPEQKPEQNPESKPEPGVMGDKERRARYVYVKSEKKWAARCGKCDGAGKISEYRHVEGGKCFHCYGLGHYGKKFDTPEKVRDHHQKLLERRVAAREKRHAETLKQIRENHIKWRKDNPQLVEVENTLNAMTENRDWLDGIPKHLHWELERDVEDAISKFRDATYIRNDVENGTTKHAEWTIQSALDVLEKIEKQRKAAQAKAKLASETKHLNAEIGQKVTVTATILKKISFTNRYNATQYVLSLRTPNNENITIFTTSAALCEAPVGATVVVENATVKEHSERDGLAQTIIGGRMKAKILE